MNIPVVHINLSAVVRITTRLFLLLVYVASLWGCSSTVMIYSTPSHDGISYSEFNQEMQSSQLTVELIDQRSFIARQIIIAADSTNFVDVRTDVRITVPTRHVKQFTLQDHAAGHSTGFLIGAVAGGIVGIGIVTGFHLVGDRWVPLWNYAFGGGITIGGILVGGLIGGAIGSATGQTSNYVIVGNSLHVK